MKLLVFIVLLLTCYSFAPSDAKKDQEDGAAADETNETKNVPKAKKPAGKDELETEEAEDPAASPAPRVASGSLVQDRKTAAELQAKILAIHKTDPKSPLQLAQRTLRNAFEKFNKGEKSVKVTDLLRSLEGIPNGKMLLFTFRMFEHMDSNKDYTITQNEFSQAFTGPVAEPSKLIELMFKIQDYNSNGLISRYEWWQTESISLGINYNLYDSWTKLAFQGINEIDTNKDGLVDLSEYTNFVVYNINKSIVQQRADIKAKQ